MSLQKGSVYQIRYVICSVWHMIGKTIRGRLSRKAVPWQSVVAFPRHRFMNLHLVPGHAAAIQLLVDLPWFNGMFEMSHVYPLPAKPNSLQLQACSLLVCSGAAQSYLAAGTYGAMPR